MKKRGLAFPSARITLHQTVIHGVNSHGESVVTTRHMTAKERRPRAGDLYRTPMDDYLILSVDRRGLTPRVTMLRFGTRRKTTIQWCRFLRDYAARYVETLIRT